ncbi:MAG TPA: adenosine kinase [Pseudomonadales bacterium]|nr:adenosine kinase [Pseudomonadales bacterium]
MSSYDVYALGNALVDMEFTVDDGFLRRHRIDKGHMTLVDEARLDELLDSLQELESKRTSGGSAANTLIAAQAFGCRTFYSCKVADDEVGAFFRKDLEAIGVATNRQHHDGAGKSGRCLVLITPDAERSMNTFLGISDKLAVSEVDERALRDSTYLYIEGFLSSSPTGSDAAIRCRELAEAHGIATAMTLSDVSMVRFFRDPLTKMLGNGVDHLFCNEEEALEWARSDRLDIAVAELKDIAHSVNVTIGARGSLVIEGHSRREVPGFQVNPIDTNGAGDIYAGACLAGWVQGMPSEAAARFGNFAAARLITRYGARLATRADYRSVIDDFRKLPT